MACQFAPEVAGRMSCADYFPAGEKHTQANSCANVLPGDPELNISSSFTSAYSRTIDGVLSPPLDAMDIDPQIWVDDVLHEYCKPMSAQIESKHSEPNDYSLFGNCGNPYEWENDAEMQDLFTASFSDMSTKPDNLSAAHEAFNTMLPKMTNSGYSYDKDLPDRPFEDPSLIPYALNVPVQHTAQHRAMVVSPADRRPQSDRVSCIHFQSSSNCSQDISSSILESGSGKPPGNDSEDPFDLGSKNGSESPPKTPRKGTKHKKLWGRDGILGYPWSAVTDEDVNADGSVNVSPHGITPHGITPHGSSPHGISPYGSSPHGISPHGISHPGVSPPNMAFQPTGAKQSNIRTISGINPITSSPGTYQLPAAPVLQHYSPTNSSFPQTPTGGRSLFRGFSKRARHRGPESNSIDLSPVSPQSFKKRPLSVSLSPKIQARLYLDLEMMITTSANSFLMHQHRNRRVSQNSINKVNAKNRHPITEFSYPQELQCELIMENRRNLEFEGICACNTVQLDSTLRSWRSLAKDMSSRTFCLPDIAIRKHVDEIYWILDMLNAPISTLREHQRLSNGISSAILGTPDNSPAQNTPLQS